MFKITDKHFILEIFGMRFKFKVLPIFLNKVFLKDKSGKCKRIFVLPKGIRIDFCGKNSTIILAKGDFYNNVTMKVFNEAFVEIKTPNAYKINYTFIEVSDCCSLEIEEDCNIVSGALVINGYNNSIKIGKSCMFAARIMIRTDDGHAILDKNTKKAINAPQDVVIGDRVWLCENSVVLKGVQIQNNTVVAVNSVVTKPVTESNVILAGVPAKIVKREICWDRRGYTLYNKEVGGT